MPAYCTSTDTKSEITPGGNTKSIQSGRQPIEKFGCGAHFRSRDSAMMKILSRSASSDSPLNNAPSDLGENIQG